MNALSLQQWVIAFRWVYDGNSIKKQISKQEAARDNLNGAIIRIGREKLSCNLYLEDGSVSGQHAEIYFNEQQQKFFIKSLSPRNTTIVDGQNLVYGEELPLKNNSAIALGRQQIEITNIQVFELKSTDYSGIVNSSSNSSLSNSSSKSVPVSSSPDSSSVKSSSNLTKLKHWWQEPTIQVAIITAIVTIFGSLLTYYTNTASQETEKVKQRLQVTADKEKQYSEKIDRHREKVRQLKEDMRKNNKYYNQLTLANNNCHHPVKVAISFTALDDVSETRGWLHIERGISPASLGAATIYDGVALHAKTTINGKEVIWEPINSPYIERHISQKEFNYIEEPFVDPNINKNNPVKFYQVKFDIGRKITNKAFNCSEAGTLELVEAD